MRKPLRLAAQLAAALGLTIGVAPVPAGARELARAAASPPGVTGCEAYGSDFRKVAGTSTCIRMGGSVSVETRWSTGGGGGFFPFAPHR